MHAAHHAVSDVRIGEGARHLSHPRHRGTLAALCTQPLKQSNTGMALTLQWLPASNTVMAMALTLQWLPASNTVMAMA